MIPFMINKISPLPKFLIDRYKKWKSSEYLKNEVNLRNLASTGQSPSTMVISCCDSRIHATSIFGAEEGEFFIHRNMWMSIFVIRLSMCSPTGMSHYHISESIF